MNPMERVIQKEKTELGNTFHILFPQIHMRTGIKYDRSVWIEYSRRFDADKYKKIAPVK